MAKLSNSQVKSQSVAYWYFRPFWTDCLNLYEPMPSSLAMYLRKYEKEEDIEFANRCSSLAQINMIYLIVEATISMIFSTNIDIKSKQHQDVVDAFVKNCTPQGDRLTDFLREQLAPSAFAYGLTDIVVDMPEDKADKLSVQQAKAKKLAPYCYLIPPLNRYNWSVDSNGHFDMYRSEDILNTEIQGNLQLAGSATERKEYQVWTTDTVERYDSDGNQTSSKPNPYGFIPIVTCAPVSKSLRYPNERLGRSLIQDVIPLQKLIINVMSLIYDFHESSNFPFRVLKQDTTNGDEPPTEEEISEQGNKRGFILRGEGSDYKIVSPDPAGVNAMLEYLQQLIERCYQQVMMPSDANVNKTHQSGNSIRSNMAVLFNKLTTYTRRMEKTVKEIVDMALRVQGIDPVEADVRVDWDTNFSYESFTNAQQQLSMVIQNLSDISPTAVAEFCKKVMGPQMFGSPMLEKVYKEFDAYAKKPIPVQNAADDPDTKPQTVQQETTQINAAEKVSRSVEDGSS
jgi:hypothetical protein